MPDGDGEEQCALATREAAVTMAETLCEAWYIDCNRNEQYP